MPSCRFTARHAPDVSEQPVADKAVEVMQQATIAFKIRRETRVQVFWACLPSDWLLRFSAKLLRLVRFRSTGAIIALSERIAMGPPLASTAFGGLVVQVVRILQLAYPLTFVYRRIGRTELAKSDGMTFSSVWTNWNGHAD